MKVRNVLWAAVIAGCGCVETPNPPGCNSDAECDDMDACTVDWCALTCEHMKIEGEAPMGEGPSQTPGDCKKLVCTGGVVTSVSDMTDAASDGNYCTADTCTAEGTSVHTAMPQGTVCIYAGQPGVCDAFGVCKANDCAPNLPPCDDANICTTDSCDIATGYCAFTPLDGVLVPGFKQVAGDCMVHNCVNGMEAAVVDDTDVPTTSSDCVTPTCTAGTPSLPPLKLGTACNTGGGKVCDGNGACVECNVNADCPPPQTCTGNPKKCQ